MENNLDAIVKAKAQQWLDGDYDAQTKEQVRQLMENDP